MFRRKDNKYEKNRWMVGWIKKIVKKIDGWSIGIIYKIQNRWIKMDYWMDRKKMKKLIDIKIFEK